MRRKDIFADLDREGGSTWSQLLHASLSVIDALEARISNKAVPPPEMTLATKRITPERLPRLVAPLEQGLVLSPNPKAPSGRAAVEAQAGALARSLGSSPSGTRALHHGLAAARDSVLTPAQQAALEPPALSHALRTFARDALQTPVGAPFRQTFAARARVKALGTPNADLDVTCLAIASIARLAAASVREDQYGTVHKDVAAILRAFARTTASLDALVRASPVHWTDTAFVAADRDVPEIDLVLTHLRCGLRFLIASFEAYATDMGLGAGELREARKAAGLAAA